MTAFDTPDGQYGVVSAQVLLAKVAGTTTTKTVVVPPNSETLIVAMPSVFSSIGVNVIGGTTGMEYPGIQTTEQRGIVASTNFFFDISSAMDPTAVVILSAAVAGFWYVYADAGVHITGDATKWSDSQGRSAVTPQPPSPISGDRIINELSYQGVQLAAAGTVVSVPPGGERWRVFAAQLVSTSGTLVGVLEDSVSGHAFCAGGPGNPGSITFPPSGLPLSTNAAVNLAVLAGAGDLYAVVAYSQETP